MRWLLYTSVAMLLAGCGSVGAPTGSEEPHGNPPQVIQGRPANSVAAPVPAPAAPVQIPAAPSELYPAERPPSGPGQPAPATTNAPPAKIGSDPCSASGGSPSKVHPQCPAG